MKARERLAEARLYGILDLGYVAEDGAEEAAQALLTGGVHVLQLRAKNYEKPRISALARRILPHCRQRGVPFIVNDHLDIAEGSGADGVHLGQEDGSLAEAFARLGPDALVGRSTHSPSQARAARDEGASYIGFGPLFPTPTKEGRPGIGLRDIAAVQAEVGTTIPVFCIGGIKMDNLEEVLAAGARRVVLVSWLLQGEDVAARCRAVRERLRD